MILTFFLLSKIVHCSLAIQSIVPVKVWWVLVDLPWTDFIKRLVLARDLGAPNACRYLVLATSCELLVIFRE